MVFGLSVAFRLDHIFSPGKHAGNNDCNNGDQPINKRDGGFDGKGQAQGGYEGSQRNPGAPVFFLCSLRLSVFPASLLGVRRVSSLLRAIVFWIAGKTLGLARRLRAVGGVLVTNWRAALRIALSVELHFVFFPEAWLPRRMAG